MQYLALWYSQFLTSEPVSQCTLYTQRTGSCTVTSVTDHDVLKLWLWSYMRAKCRVIPQVKYQALCCRLQSFGSWGFLLCAGPLGVWFLNMFTNSINIIKFGWQHVGFITVTIFIEQLQIDMNFTKCFSSDAHVDVYVGNLHLSCSECSPSWLNFYVHSLYKVHDWKHFRDYTLSACLIFIVTEWILIRGYTPKVIRYIYLSTGLQILFQALFMANEVQWKIISYHM